MEPGLAFGRVLRQLRTEAGLTQEQLGFEADLQRNYVSILELGQQQPSLGTILKLSAALSRPASDIVGLVQAELANAKQAGKRARKK